MDNKETYDIELERKIENTWKKETIPSHAFAQSMKLIKNSLNQQNYGGRE